MKRKESTEIHRNPFCWDGYMKRHPQERGAKGQDDISFSKWQQGWQGSSSGQGPDRACSSDWKHGVAMAPSLPHEYTRIPGRCRTLIKRPPSAPLNHSQVQGPTKLNHQVSQPCSCHGALSCHVLFIFMRGNCSPGVLTTVLLCNWTSTCAARQGRAGPSPTVRLQMVGLGTAKFTFLSALTGFGFLATG